MHRYLVASLVLPVLLAGADIAVDFADGNLGPGWEVTGDAAVVPEHGGSLRLGPGARAVLWLRDTDGSGEVSFRVLDDGAKAARPRERAAGPTWGVIARDGRVLVVGPLYAPYLNGAETYAATDHLAGETPFARVRYLGIRRDDQWHTWTFRFDPDKGGAILRDGRDVNAQRERFDWNQSKMPAFAGLVLLGDATPDKAHTIWVNQVRATLGPPMQVAPTPPPPPPPIVPPEDPAPEHLPPVVPALAGRHPRLLFTPEELPALRERAETVSAEFFASLESYLEASRPPDHKRYLTDATDGQRQGLWRLPTVALHYALTGNRDSFAHARRFLDMLAEDEHWETGAEQDAGMSSANLMIGFALGYDLLWNDLEPGERERFRRKLLLMARRQYYRGHLGKGGGVRYWQGDPGNNHRWHRNGGLALAVAAVAGDGPGDEWLRERLVEELRFVHRWLPEDGSSHESPSYLIFGLPHLVLAFDTCDRVFGTDLMEHPFFREAVRFRLHTLAPGFNHAFGFGDDSETGFGGYHPALWRCLGETANPAEYHLLRAFQAAQPQAFAFGWMSLVWHRPPTGEATPMPQAAHFPDLGLLALRDGWGENAVALVFKCGPYGGHTLNEFRHAPDIDTVPYLANSNPPRYINVAHDDPDANSFLLFADGAMLAKSDGYAYRKQTASHNTLLINGKGQRGEGAHWTQPVRGVDMRTLARLTAVTHLPRGGVVAEGEAGASYPDLDTYRRILAWMPGDYVLLLDHIRAPHPVEATWLAQSRAVETEGPRLVLSDGDSRLTALLAASANLELTVADSPADHRGKSLGYRQARATLRGDSLRLAAVLDPWNRGPLALAVDGEGAVEVRGPFGADRWEIAVPTPDGAAVLRASRDGNSLLP